MMVRVTVLDLLLEGFNPDELRGWHGRWIRGRGGKPGRLEGSYNGVKLVPGRAHAYQGKLADGSIFTGHFANKLDNGEPVFKHVDTGAERTFRGGKFFGRLRDVKP